jgi:hypothetical protein
MEVIVTYKVAYIDRTDELRHEDHFAPTIRRDDARIESGGVVSGAA